MLLDRCLLSLVIIGGGVVILFYFIYFSSQMIKLERRMVNGRGGGGRGDKKWKVGQPQTHPGILNLPNRIFHKGPHSKMTAPELNNPPLESHLVATESVSVENSC